MTNVQTRPYAIPVGIKVVDRDGFRGTVAKITEWEGSRWYDVRFSAGQAVRYDSDLTIDSVAL